MQRREIVLNIVLSIITCGIFALVWMAMVTDDLRRGSDNEDFFSGGICVLLYFVTVGWFGLYWAYKMGEMVNTIKQNRGKPIDTNLPILYLVIELLSGIINLALMQNEINKVVE